MVRRTAARTKRAPLSLDRIIDATLRLIDEEGIGVASMRTIGSRLGVRAMSLYRYVDNREELFDAVVDRIVSELDHDDEVAPEPVDGWRPYLSSLAWGIRRYALAHPHAFPLVATRPSAAPWVNPPLRSVRWIEALLAALRRDGFSDDEVLFAYRSFNSFLLGFLLLETSAMTLRDPKPGDGSFQSGDGGGRTDPADSSDPVPGGLTATRPAEHREALAGASDAEEVIDPVGDVDARRFPTIHDLRVGLAAAYYEKEFASGLSAVLDRIAVNLASADDRSDSDPPSGNRRGVGHHDVVPGRPDRR